MSIKKYVAEMEWIEEGSGESGYMIYLKDGYSFDPMNKNDSSVFVSSSESLKEFLESQVVHKI